MAITIPKLEDLYNQILNDYATVYGIELDEIGDTEKVQAKVDAGIIYTLYLGLSNEQNNIYPDLAEESVLVRYGYEVLKRYPATADQGVYEVEVKGDVGAVVVAGTQFISNQDSLNPEYLFILDEDFTLTSTVDSMTLRSLTAGQEAALNIGNDLTAIQPLLNVNNEVGVTSITNSPSDAEDIESYREDVLEGMRLLPQGGSPGDYRLWTSSIAEILKVYPYHDSLGMLNVYVEATVENTSPGEIEGVPTQAVLDEVYTKPAGAVPESGVLVINPVSGAGRKPITVNNINSLSIIPVGVEVEFTGLSDINIIDEIEGALTIYLRTIRPFIAGADQLINKKDILTAQNILIEVIKVTSPKNITFTGMVVKVDSVEIVEYQFIDGRIPYLEDVTNS